MKTFLAWVGGIALVISLLGGGAYLANRDAANREKARLQAETDRRDAASRRKAERENEARRKNDQEPEVQVEWTRTLAATWDGEDVSALVAYKQNGMLKVRRCRLEDHWLPKRGEKGVFHWYPGAWLPVFQRQHDYFGWRPIGD